MSINFTEAEWLMLSSFGYVIPTGQYDENGNLTNPPIPIDEEVVKLIRKNAIDGAGDQITDEYMATLESMLAKLQEGNFVITKCVNHNSSDKSGLVAFSIEPAYNPNNEVIVLFRGSDGDILNNLNDWIDSDAGLAWEDLTPQQKEVLEFMKQFENYDSIYTTGHSLGGNLAIFAAIIFAFLFGEAGANKIKNVYAFDAPGFNNVFINRFRIQIEQLQKRIFNIRCYLDIVSDALIPIGEIVNCDSSSLTIFGHERWLFKIDENGNLVRYPFGRGQRAKNYHYINLFIGNISMLINAFINRTRQRDFTEAMREKLLSLVKEVEEEPWWDVTRWDCWYRIEQRLNLLSYGLYEVSGNINSYWRKLIDINDTSKEEIINIFNQVEELDGSYSQNIQSKLNEINEEINKINSLADKIVIN